MCSQLTYEGLIDEIYGISNSMQPGGRRGTMLLALLPCIMLMGGGAHNSLRGPGAGHYGLQGEAQGPAEQLRLAVPAGTRPAVVVPMFTTQCSIMSRYRTVFTPLQIRDRNFSTVGPILNQSAKRINAEYEVSWGALWHARSRN